MSNAAQNAALRALAVETIHVAGTRAVTCPDRCRRDNAAVGFNDANKTLDRAARTANGDVYQRGTAELAAELYRCAVLRALDSLAYSVGKFSPDHKAGRDALSALLSA